MHIGVSGVLLLMARSKGNLTVFDMDARCRQWLRAAELIVKDACEKSDTDRKAADHVAASCRTQAALFADRTRVKKQAYRSAAS